MAFDNTKSYSGPIAADDAIVVNLANAPFIQYGTAAQRPVFGNRGILYWATDTKVLSYDTGAAWAIVDPSPYTVIASNTLLQSADTERTSQDAVYTKYKEIQLNRDGIYRIKFDSKIVTGGTEAKVRIYRNGVAVGTEQYHTYAVYTTFSEDISGWTAGDLCQIYMFRFAGAGTVYVNNFRIYGDGFLTVISPTVITD